MSPKTSSSRSPASAPSGHVNSVELRGRLSGDAVSVVLPSGDELVSFRLVVPRPAARPARTSKAVRDAGGGAGRRVPTSDTIDCVVRSTPLRRRMLRTAPDTRLAVTGALHRRFYRGPAGLASRYEVEVARVVVARIEVASVATDASDDPTAPAGTAAVIG